MKPKRLSSPWRGPLSSATRIQAGTASVSRLPASLSASLWGWIEWVCSRSIAAFHINPFKTWLVVVAISAISYGSYVLQKLTKGRGGIELAALLGGAYSSTVTTVVMARRAAREQIGRASCRERV